MEIAAMISFAVLVLSWMALPASGRVLEEKSHTVIRAQAAPAKA